MKKKSKKKLTLKDLAQEDARIAKEQLWCETTLPHGHTVTFPAPGAYEFDAQVEYVTAEQARINRLEVHDGTAELRLKLKNSLDLIAWENNGKTITGKAEKLRFIVYVGDEDSYVGIYEKPFLGDAQLVRHLDIDNSLYEKIALRASTSVPNRNILKLLTAL